ncbi:hypothetical protein BDQ17DRAFT_1337365 [Cyathus striatus]|nr:hypothetical protein BDQ17DRAFT_1337365 [Cyathus striatus]
MKWFPAAFHELSNTQLFTVNELVESISIDPVHQWLAASSHMGKVKLCSIHRNGSLTTLWIKDFSSDSARPIIPQVVHFYDSYKTILVFFLETGEILSRCCLSYSGMEDWHKVLKSPIDNGRLHLYSTLSSSKIQTLCPGGWRSHIQAVNAISSLDRKLIASSSSDKSPLFMCGKNSTIGIPSFMNTLNFLAILFLFWLTADVWKGYVHEALCNVVGRVHASLNDHKDPTSNTQFGPINHKHNNDNYVEIEDNAVEKSKWDLNLAIEPNF